MTNKAKKATVKVEDFAAEAQKTVTEQVEKVSKGFEEATEFSQQNVESLVKSSEIAAKAVESINEEVVSYSKKSFEDTVEAAKDIASAKTANELFEKQTAFARAAFEGFVSQATKMSEMYLAAAKEISAPINERVEVAGEALKGKAA